MPCWVSAGRRSLRRSGRVTVGFNRSSSGISAYLASGLVLIAVPREASFIAANVAWGFAFYFTLPYLLGTLAALDRRGLWTVAGTGALGVGIAIGPVLTGALIARGWSWVGWFLAVSTPVTLALFVPAIRAVEAAGPSSSAEPAERRV